MSSDFNGVFRGFDGSFDFGELLNAVNEFSFNVETGGCDCPICRAANEPEPTQPAEPTVPVTFNLTLNEIEAAIKAVELIANAGFPTSPFGNLDVLNRAKKRYESQRELDVLEAQRDELNKKISALYDTAYSDFDTW